MRILGICGSLQARSGNLELLQVAAKVAPPGVEVMVVDLLRELPPFDPDLEETPPPAVATWRRALADSDALLVASPEYGHSLPGALKNGIDWVIGSGELYRKVIATTAAVLHRERGARGLAALGLTLRAVDAVIVGEQPIVRNAGLEDAVRALLAALLAAVEAQPADYWSRRPGTVK